MAVLANERTVEAAADQAVDMVARLVARPFLVHIVVDAWQHAQHLPPAAVDTDIGADRIRHVDAQCLGQLPRPRLERIGLAGQRADRAEVDDVTRQFARDRSEEHTSELQSLMRNSYAVFCLKTNK